MTVNSTVDATVHWRSRVLEQVDADREAMLGMLSAMVQVPSVSGSDEENSAQAELAAVLDGSGLEVDHWRVPLAATLADPTFPGAEVPRSEAWGLVARLPGRGDGPCLCSTATSTSSRPDRRRHGAPASPTQAWCETVPCTDAVPAT